MFKDSNTGDYLGPKTELKMLVRWKIKFSYHNKS